VRVVKPGDGQTTYGLQIQPRMGFFTDTSICIGCKACEVACKEWNLVPEDGLVWTGHSYDNTGELSANTWRHVAFVEQQVDDGLQPACAKACPTQSIQFGPLDELLARAEGRVEELHEAGVEDAHLYLADETDGIGGAGAFFLLLDKPEVYGLPPDPVDPTK